MSGVFDNLWEIKINLNAGADLSPVLTMLETLYGEASPYDHALAAAYGKPLVQVTETDIMPKSPDELIHSITVDGRGGNEIEDIIGSSIELSGIFKGTPVTFSGNGNEVTVSCDDNLDEVLDRWYNKPSASNTAQPS